jgi:photosystem II stability/assembly factor-like uncharacterized protein
MKPGILILATGLFLFPLAPAAHAATWKPIGPDGGQVEALAYAPSDSQVAYAGTFGGGVFRSGDGGSSWTAVNSGLPSLTVFSVAVDPNEPAVAYAGTAFGLYVTTSGGASWTALPLGSASVRPQVTMVRIDPSHPRILYAVANAGVFRSADGGAHWTERDAGLPAPPKQQSLTALEVDSNHPGTLYAGFFNSDFASPAQPSLYETTDGGGHWIASTTLQAFQIFTLALQRSTGLLYAGTSDGLMSSPDGGATWMRLCTDLVASLVVAPSGTLYGDLVSGVDVSTDGGRTWTDPAPLSPSRPSDQIFSLALDPPGDRLLVADGFLGVDSLTSGSGWTRANQGLRATAVDGVAAASTNPPLLFVATLGEGVLVSGDGGADFISRNAGLSMAVTQQVSPLGLTFHPKEPRSLVTGFGDGSVGTTSDAGRHWRLAPSICRPADVLGFSPPSTIFVSSDATGFFCTGRFSCHTQVSRDGGATFTCIDGPDNVSAFLVDPLRPVVVYAAAGAVLWKSTDRGFHFTQIADGLGVVVRTLASSPAARQTLYAGGDAGVIKSVDGGLTWSPVGAGVLGGVTALVVDPSNPALVYVTAYISNGILLSHGVFASRDAGATWSRLGDGLPGAVNAAQLALDPLNHVLFAGTSGSGVWALAVP